MDPKQVAVRLQPEERAELTRWAHRQAQESPALRGKLFRIDGSPRMSTVVRHAALKEVRG